jgi:hypothetical protein
MQASRSSIKYHCSLQLTSTQKKFVDAVNGKSGLTFFDALESEVWYHMTSSQTPKTKTFSVQELNGDRERIPDCSQRPDPAQGPIRNDFSHR